MFYSAKNSSHKVKLVSEKRGNITSIAVHAARGMVVTGHEYGEITVWRDMDKFLQTLSAAWATGSEAKGSSVQPTKTTLHWHAHAGIKRSVVCSLCI